MRPSIPGLINTWYKKVILLIILVAVGLSAYLLLRSEKTHPIQESTNPGVLADNQKKDSSVYLKGNNYQAATASYLLEANNQMGAGNYQGAKSTLQNCIAKVPDSYVPYTIYDSLVAVAKQLNDKTLEKSSLQKAIEKALQPGSGAGDATIQIYKTELAKLG